MRARALMVLSLVVALAMPATAAAQQPSPVRAVATLSATSVALGERLRLTVTVLHPANVLVSVDPPVRTATLQLVEVAPRPATPLATTSTEVTSRFEYVIAAFALGDTQLPPQLVSWLDAEGETGEVQAAPPSFTVAATSAPADTNLHPLKAQLDVTGAPPAWQRPAAAASVLVLVLAVVGATLARRARHRPATQAAPIPIEALAEGAARRRLDALATANPLAEGDYDTYYGTIATVARDYLQQRFGFNARSLTTTELQQRMVALGVERWQARLVSGLLDRCDAAVYAGRRPDPISADHDLTVAFEIVELARPQQAPNPEGREATAASHTAGTAR
jgi:hypothetical protein